MSGLISAILFAVTLSYAFFQETVTPQSIQNIKGENYIMNQTDSLPFNLSREDLASVDILYAYYSAKTGAGKQEIMIAGNGLVKLFLTHSMYDEEPKTKEGKLDPENFILLLNIIEGENFFGLEDFYPPADDPHSRRVIRLSLPEKTKTVVLEGGCVPEFERIASAVKFAIGTALPEAINYRFFPNLM